MRVAGLKHGADKGPTSWANSRVIVGIIGGEPFGGGCGQQVIVGGYEHKESLARVNQWLVKQVRKPGERRRSHATADGVSVG